MNRLTSKAIGLNKSTNLFSLNKCRSFISTSTIVKSQSIYINNNNIKPFNSKFKYNHNFNQLNRYLSTSSSSNQTTEQKQQQDETKTEELKVAEEKKEQEQETPKQETSKKSDDAKEKEEVTNVESKEDATKQKTEKYLAFFRNVPSLEFIQQVENEGDILSFMENVKPYSPSNSNTYNDPRYIGILAYLLKAGGKSPIELLSPFTYFAVRPSLATYTYYFLPSLFKSQFPKWIDYDDFIANSVVSLFKLFEASFNNEVETFKQMSTENGFLVLLYLRDLFYTFKRIAYQISFTNFDVRMINVTTEDNTLKIYVEYQLFAKYDVNVPKSKDISYPIRNPSDAETKSMTTSYLFGITWSSPIPESKDENDLEWKIDFPGKSPFVIQTK